MSCCDGCGVKLSQSSNLKQRENSTTMKTTTTSKRNTSRNLLPATFQGRKTGGIKSLVKRNCPTNKKNHVRLFFGAICKGGYFESNYFGWYHLNI